MSDSKARSLLAQAAEEEQALRRHLLVAAALSEVLPTEPIVVGGTAEEYWTAVEYHETDLDLCVPFGARGREVLEGLGFGRHGRHWARDDLRVAVEIPSSRIDGDVERTIVEPVGEGKARIIGVDDLYLDRVRQATLAEGRDDIHFDSALAVAVTCFEAIDWPYVDERIMTAVAEERLVGEAMARVDVRVRRRAREVLTEP